MADERKFWPADEVRVIATSMIGTDERFRALRRTRICYLFKKKAATVRGKPQAGTVRRWGDLQNEVAELAGGKRFDYVVIVAHDYWCSLSNKQKEALVFHQLCHIDPPDGIRAHDFEGFKEELEAFGFWNLDLLQIAEAVRQLDLFSEEDEEPAGGERDADVTVEAEERP